MANRVCRACPAIGPWKRGRCPDHERQAERARGTKTERGYGSAIHETPIGRMTYDQCRREYQRRISLGVPIKCWRCQQAIDPEHWTLGHDDECRAVIRGPEHAGCNYSAAGRMSTRPGRI